MASGTDLKVERTRAGLTQLEVARRMQISRQALWSLERAEMVDEARATQYRAALVSADATDGRRHVA